MNIMPTEQKKKHIATATLRYLRMSPRKVRAAAYGLRNKWVIEADEILTNRGRRAAGPLQKLLESASANAVKNHSMVRDNLFISEIFVSGGPMFSRYMPRARGSAYEIQKKTSHVTIVLGERDGKLLRRAAVRQTAARHTEETAEQKTSGGRGEHKKYTSAQQEKALPKQKSGIAKRFFSRKAI